MSFSFRFILLLGFILTNLISTSHCFQPTIQQGGLVNTNNGIFSTMGHKNQLLLRGSASSTEGIPSKKRCIEVEEKFSLSELDINVFVDKLSTMGFVKGTENVEFMDWYFDLPDPDWVLSLSDNWLRFRELIRVNEEDKSDGSWQMKCGTQIHNDNSGTTVYEELEGDEAINMAMSIIKDKTYSTVNTRSETLMDGYVIPSLPINADKSGLTPFARIKTTRSSWIFKDKDDPTNNLNIDIDVTDFGYLVGEVEQVVESEEEVSVSKLRIQKVIEQITDASNYNNNGPALGKLELYMIRNRKQHFEECVRHGVMKNKK